MDPTWSPASASLAELSGLAEELASAPGVSTTADRTRSSRQNYRHSVERQMCRPWGVTPRPRRSTSPS